MRRLVFVVSRDNLEKFEELKREFANEEIVDVILDRRHADRRVRDVTPELERRHGDRRRREVQPQLQEKGWALIRRFL